MAEFELESGEHVIASVRKHPLIAVGNLLPYALLAVIPLFLPAIAHALANLNAAVPFADFITAENPWTRFIIGMYWLFTWMGAFGVFTDYYLDHWVVTNHRIMSIDQAGFFDRRISSLHLNRVQDVMTDVEGIFAELFGFGTLSVETAGDDPTRFRIDGIRNAGHIRDLIMKEVTKRQENLTRISSSGIN